MESKNFLKEKKVAPEVLFVKVLWKYVTNLQENTNVEVWFQQSCVATLLKSHSSAWVSVINLLHIFRTPFTKTTSRWLPLKLRNLGISYFSICFVLLSFRLCRDHTFYLQQDLKFLGSFAHRLKTLQQITLKNLPTYLASHSFVIETEAATRGVL